MFRTISYKANQLNALYQKLIIKNNLSGAGFVHHPILLTGSYLQLANHYTVLSAELQFDFPFELQQIPVAYNSEPTGLFIHLFDSPNIVQYCFKEQPVNSIKQGMLIVTDDQPFSVFTEEPYQGFWLLAYLSKEWCEANLLKKSLSLPQVMPLPPQAKQYSQELFRLGKPGNAQWALYRTALLNQLFSRITIVLSELSEQTSDYLTITLIKQYLIEHLDQKLPLLQTLAERANMSNNMLKRKFYEFENQSLEQFFINQKMESALSQLKSDKTIKEISLNLGYGNSSNFINAFKRKFGISPSQYKSKGEANTRF